MSNGTAKPSCTAAAAKNYAHLVIIADPADNTEAARQLIAKEAVNERTRELLAVKAFDVTVAYDALTIFSHGPVPHSTGLFLCKN